MTKDKMEELMKIMKVISQQIDRHGERLNQKMEKIVEKNKELCLSFDRVEAKFGKPTEGSGSRTLSSTVRSSKEKPETMCRIVTMENNEIFLQSLEAQEIEDVVLSESKDGRSYSDESGDINSARRGERISALDGSSVQNFPKDVELQEKIFVAEGCDMPVSRAAKYANELENLGEQLYGKCLPKNGSQVAKRLSANALNLETPSVFDLTEYWKEGNDFPGKDFGAGAISETVTHEFENISGYHSGIPGNLREVVGPTIEEILAVRKGSQCEETRTNNAHSSGVHFASVTASATVVGILPDYQGTDFDESSAVIKRVAESNLENASVFGKETNNATFCKSESEKFLIGRCERKFSDEIGKCHYAYCDDQWIGHEAMKESAIIPDIDRSTEIENSADDGTCNFLASDSTGVKMKYEEECYGGVVEEQGSHQDKLSEWRDYPPTVCNGSSVDQYSAEVNQILDTLLSQVASSDSGKSRKSFKLKANGIKHAGASCLQQILDISDDKLNLKDMTSRQVHRSGNNVREWPPGHGMCLLEPWKGTEDCTEALCTRHQTCLTACGSRKCLCHEGDRFEINGRTRQDVYEAKPEVHKREADVDKGKNKVCFNIGGSSKCGVITFPSQRGRNQDIHNRYKRTLVECQFDDVDCLQDSLYISDGCSYCVSNGDRRDRCERSVVECKFDDEDCLCDPFFITSVTIAKIPPTRRLDPFTMHRPPSIFIVAQFTLELEAARSSYITVPAKEQCFQLKTSDFNEAMVTFANPKPGPQELELNLHPDKSLAPPFGGIVLSGTDST